MTHAIVGFLGIFGIVWLICWLAVDIFGIDVGVEKPLPQIVVTKQGNYECVKLINERASTCRKVQE